MPSAVRAGTALVNDDDTPIYRLYALFDGTYQRGEPRTGEACWLNRRPCIEPTD